LAAEALGLRERRLRVGNLDVERHVAAVALRPTANSAVDPIGVLERRVVGLAHWLAELPSEQLAVVAAQLIRILPHHLEMHDRIGHQISPFLAVGTEGIRLPLASSRGWA